MLPDTIFNKTKIGGNAKIGKANATFFVKFSNSKNECRLFHAVDFGAKIVMSMILSMKCYI